MKGSEDLLKATFAFHYFNQYTACFPIRFKILPPENGTWAAVMLVSHRTACVALSLTHYSSQTTVKTRA